MTHQPLFHTIGPTKEDLNPSYYTPIQSTNFESKPALADKC